MSSAVFVFLRTVNELLTAGIAIMAFALLLYVLTFNLRNRVARSFAAILACVTVVFVGDAIGSAASLPAQVEFWLDVQWIGVIFLPPAYFHASDALLETTGLPSRGRRRLVIRLTYLVSILFLLLLPTGYLVGPLVEGQAPAPYLQQTWLSWVFTLYYAGIVLWAGANLWRSYRRTVTRTSSRRMIYLMAGATAPALGSYPYLLIGNAIAAGFPLLFWVVAVASNLLVTVLLVLMAYAMAFFGVAWPDRVVKTRLFKWILRGPVTASTALAITTIVRRAGELVGVQYSAAVPIVMVATILTLQYLISLSSPFLERWLFHGGDYTDLKALQDLENRLLTRRDLQQFLEVILAAVCERLQAPAAFLAALGDEKLEMIVAVGDRHLLQQAPSGDELLQVVTQNHIPQELFTWGRFHLVPLFEENGATRKLSGLIGIPQADRPILDESNQEALAVLTERAGLALRDWRVQKRIFASLQDLSPQVELIQRLRAAARYDGATLLQEDEAQLEQEKLLRWTREALSHYWGGPRLTESPLLQLGVVRKAIQAGESPANALRAILRDAIDNVRPQGERRFTAEWILYNILEMKFVEGRKVREIASRLAMSEADFYRKQRVAIEEVAKSIADMENQILLDRQLIQASANPIPSHEV